MAQEKPPQPLPSPLHPEAPLEVGPVLNKPKKEFIRGISVHRLQVKHLERRPPGVQICKMTHSLHPHTHAHAPTCPLPSVSLPFSKSVSLLKLIPRALCGIETSPFPFMTPQFLANRKPLLQFCKGVRYKPGRSSSQTEPGRLPQGEREDRTPRKNYNI